MGALGVKGKVWQGGNLVGAALSRAQLVPTADPSQATSKPSCKVRASEILEEEKHHTVRKEKTVKRAVQASEEVLQALEHSQLSGQGSCWSRE